MNTTTCWYCKKDVEYDGEKYRDFNCPKCGVLNSVFDVNNPVLPIGEPKIEEEDMGALKDRAREKSPFVTLAIGEKTPILIYKSWKETQDHWGNETFRYMFELETLNGLVEKQLDNRSMQFAEAMDAIPFGVKVIISREPKRDEDGSIIEDKSVWTVQKVE